MAQEQKLRNATLVFLIKRSGESITDICLAMKKRGFGVNQWNGTGGKVDSVRETIEEAACREAQEEINVAINQLNKVAELAFYFPHNPAWDQLVHVYFAEQWSGEPSASEEMMPQWFTPSEMPYDNMWPDDIFWLPEVLKGNRLKAVFKFGEDDVVQHHEISFVENF